MIADDHPAVRNGLRAMVASSTVFGFIETVCNGREAVERLAALSFDVVLMNVRMPEMDGVAATRLITQRHPGVRVIAVSVEDDGDTVKAMFAAGAMAYLLKDAELADIEHAVRAAAAGNVYLATPVGRALAAYYRRGATAPVLTTRERDVLRCLAQGLSSKQIAGKLLLSTKTIDLCRSQLLEKMGCKNSNELVGYAYRNDLIADAK
ncbi:MAG TPA: response regulator transcription factor [Chitinophagales bacterium]|nr:response regulator transcription factor [Chitinophagales bacterium]